MKIRLTSKDFILLLGIMVAGVIVIATLFYRDSLITTKPGVSKKVQAANHAAVMLQKTAQVLFQKD
jgi:hypothetical protein